MTMTDVSEAPAKADAVAAQIRGRIVGGDWRPGERLPTRPELKRELGVSNETVQVAFSRLIDEGFLRVAGRNGTYVTDAPPHLSRYGLVFSGTQAESARSGIWQALLLAAAEREGLPFEPFYGSAETLHHPESLPFVESVLNHRLAGLVFLFSPFRYAGTPLLTAPGIPRVAFSGPGALAGVDCALNFGPNRERVRLLLERLRATGRSRLALITRHDQHGDYQMLLRELLPASEAAGVATRESWHLGVATDSPLFTRNLVQLLFDDQRGSCPDAIYVTDDTVLATVAAAIAAVGLRVPEDVELIAHANFPYLPGPELPVWRFGVDATEVLRRATDLIDARRRGETISTAQPVSICTSEIWQARQTQRSSEVHS